MPRYINADLTDTEILDAVQEETADTDTFITVRRILNKLPTADVAPVIHAEWEYMGFGAYRCSNCKKWIDLETDVISKYCPKCGAKMDEEVEEYNGTEE